MVYNVFGKDFRMGTTDEMVKKMYRYDSLKKNIKELTSLLGTLQPADESYTAYATHKDTGLVYDISVITKQVKNISEELDALDQSN